MDALDGVVGAGAATRLGAAEQVAGLAGQAGVERGGRRRGAAGGRGRRRRATAGWPPPTCGRPGSGAPMWAVIVGRRVERGGDLLVGPERRAGEVPGARRRALRQRRREGAVGGAQLARRGAPWYVADADQRVAERQPVAVGDEHPGRERRRGARRRRGR